jgi:hypothetical protein
MKQYYLLVAAVLSFSAAQAQLIDEDFSAAAGETPPPGWTVTDISSSGVNWVFNNPSEYEVISPLEGEFAILDSDYFSDTESPEDAVLVSPPFNASAVSGSLVLSFDHWFVPDVVGEWAVEVYNGTAWTEVMSGNTLMEEPQAEYVDITAAAGGSANAQVRFHWTGVWDYFWMVDNVLVMDETCPPVTALGASSITSSSALAAWNPGGSETSWNISYGPAGFEPEDGTIESVDTDPQYAISGLTTGMSYDFYVQADCGGGDESVWMGPYTFTTLCAPVAITQLPWSDGFESATIPGLSCGWSVEDVESDATTWYSEEFDTGNQAMLIDYNLDGTTPLDDWLFTPEFVLDAGTIYQLSFDELSGYGFFEENLEVAIGTSAAAASMTAELLDLPGVMSEDFTNHVVNFSVPADGSYYIGFRAYSEPDMIGIWLDNVMLSEAPACPEVSGVTLGGVTSGSATVTWTEGFGETNWIVEYGEEGFTPGEGDSILVSGTPSANISGLDGETTYDVYVTADCGGDGVAVAAGPVTFTTFCLLPVITDYPWTEDFETAEYGSLPCGWVQDDSNLDEIFWAVSDEMAASGMQSLAVSYNSSQPMDDWAITPGFQMYAGTEYTISFNYAVFDDFYPESFEFFAGMGQNPDAMTTSLADFDGIVNMDFEAHEITFNPTTSGVWYFGVHGNSDEDMYTLFIDDMMIEKGACEPESAAFSYASAELCTDDDPATPAITGNTGGMFSSSAAGLTIDAATGVITPSSSAAGDYTVTYITSGSDCADTTTVTVSIEQCGLGIGEGVLAAAAVYPNPTSGAVHVSLPAGVDGVSCAVTDLTGKVIAAATEIAGGGAVIDLSSQANGVYLVKLSSPSGSKVFRVVRK